MPTTIPESFRKLRQNLEITGLQEATVSTRQTNIRKVVETDLAVVDSFLTGSYSRNTMIAPLQPRAERRAGRVAGFAQAGLVLPSGFYHGQRSRPG